MRGTTKKCFSLLLVFCLLLTLLPMSALATVEIARGTIGEGGAPWRLYSNGTLVVDAGTIHIAEPEHPWTWRSPWNVESEKVHRIIFTDSITAGASLQRLFLNLQNVTSIEGLEHFDTSNVRNMRAMFAGTSSLATLEGLEGWDTRNVQNMNNMFGVAHGLVSLDLSNWDTGNVTDMSHMFWLTSLTNLNVSGWDTRNVVDMSGMFRDASNLTNLNLSGWNTGNVQNMSDMFWNAWKLTALDVANWDTGNVRDMSRMFSGTSGLVNLNVSNWDTGNVTDMSNMFWFTSLTNLNVSNWDTRNVQNMNNMFGWADNLTSLDLSNWDVSSVTTMRQMLRGTSAIKALNLSSWDTRNVQNMDWMFSDSLRQLTLGESFRFAGIHYLPALPPAPRDESFRGRWQQVGSGTADDPQGALVFTSEELMQHYDGSTMADTWVWQPRVPGDFPFDDVPADHWAESSIWEAYRRDYIQGIGRWLFHPSGTLTRAEATMLLWNISETPTPNAPAPFTDVTDHWAATAITWAAEAGIVSGRGNGIFAPDDTITREELFVILRNFAQNHLGLPAVAGANVPRFPDHHLISDWTEPAVLWLRYMDLINGNAYGEINPLGTASRAEAATIVVRFVQSLMD